MRDRAVEEVIRDLQEKIADGELSSRAAAEQIGTTVGSLQRHLAGHYVRSDSLAKYRRWLRGGSPEASVRPQAPDPASNVVSIGPRRLVEKAPPQPRPFRVVDLFSGTGGLSLGFELG